jgi:hypothetical protein
MVIGPSGGLPAARERAIPCTVAGPSRSQVDFCPEKGRVRWLGTQEYVGRSIGDTETHAIFAQPKEGPSRVPYPRRRSALGALRLTWVRWPRGQKSGGEGE